MELNDLDTTLGKLNQITRLIVGLYEENYNLKKENERLKDENAKLLIDVAFYDGRMPPTTKGT